MTPGPLHYAACNMEYIQLFRKMKRLVKKFISKWITEFNDILYFKSQVRKVLFTMTWQLNCIIQLIKNKHLVVWCLPIADLHHHHLKLTAPSSWLEWMPSAFCIHQIVPVVRLLSQWFPFRNLFLVFGKKICIKHEILDLIML